MSRHSFFSDLHRHCKTSAQINSADQSQCLVYIAAGLIPTCALLCTSDECSLHLGVLLSISDGFDTVTQYF